MRQAVIKHSLPHFCFRLPLNPMLRTSASTLLQYSVTLLAVLILNFTLPRLAPGDPADYLFPPELAGTLTPEQREELMADFELDGTTWSQFRRYIGGLAQGDLLLSVRYRQPVLDVLLERLPWTLLLTGSSLLLTTTIGIGLGFWSAWRRGQISDVSTLITVLFIDALPGFFVGMLFILLFSVKLGWFPIIGSLAASRATGVEFWIEAAKRLVMPVVTLTLATLAPVYLSARAALISEINEDYLLMAEAKGLAERQIRRHAQRNALLPLSSIVLLNIGTLVGGATLIETVFSYPGLGVVIFQGVAARDYPLLQGAFLFMALAVIGANFIGGLLYPLLDPRLRTPASNA